MGVEDVVRDGNLMLRGAREERAEDMLPSVASVIRFVMENAPSVLSLFTPEIIPARADAELCLRAKLHERTYHGDSMQAMDRAKMLFRARYGAEEEALDARHPRRVTRLWNAVRLDVARRYGRDFASPEQYIQMRALFDARAELEEHLDTLASARSKSQVIADAAAAEPGVGWEEASLLWQKYALGPAAFDALAHLVGAASDALKPARVVASRQTFDDFDEPSALRPERVSANYRLNYARHGAHPLDFASISFERLAVLTRDIRAFKDERLSFYEALWYLEPELVSGLADIPEDVFESYHAARPSEMQALVQGFVTEQYRERSPQARHVVRTIADHLLARWRQTSQDYTLVFDMHDVDHRTRKWLEALHALKTGPNPGNRRLAVEGRLPAALQMLVDDGYLAEVEIDPPLPETKNRRDIRALPAAERKRLLATLPYTPPKALAAGEKIPGAQYPLTRRGDWTLEQIAREGERVLYRSARLTILGKQVIDSITHDPVYVEHTVISALSSSANETYDGPHVDGKASRILRLQRYAMEEELSRLFANSYNDLLPAESLVLFAEGKPERLTRDHVADLLALAHIFYPTSDAEDVDPAYAALREPIVDGSSYALSGLGKLTASTIALPDGVAFMLRAHRPYVKAAMFGIAMLAADYLRENKVGFRVQQHTGDVGRRTQLLKIAARDYALQYGEEVVAALQGNGLVNVLAYALVSSETALHDFGPAPEPCEVCGKTYFDGVLGIKEMQRGWWDGVHGKDLHTLRDHPTTFVDTYGSLEQIHTFIKGVQGQPEPAFLAVPSIQEQFFAWRATHRAATRARAASYDFWEETAGGLGRFEPEEIEDSVKLQALVEKEARLHREERATAREQRFRAVELHRAYVTAGGKAPLRRWGANAIVHFWSQQGTLLDIYQLHMPTALPAVGGARSQPVHETYWSR